MNDQSNTISGLPDDIFCLSNSNRVVSLYENGKDVYESICEVSYKLIGSNDPGFEYQTLMKWLRFEGFYQFYLVYEGARIHFSVTKISMPVFILRHHFKRVNDAMEKMANASNK